MMKLKNKLTKETLELSYQEFCKKFSNEIQVAFENYKQTAIAKIIIRQKFRLKNSLLKNVEKEIEIRRKDLFHFTILCAILL